MHKSKKKNVSKNNTKILAPNLDEETKVMLMNGSFARINKLRAYWDYTDLGVPKTPKALFLIRVYQGDMQIYQNTVFENGFTQLKNYIQGFGIQQATISRSGFNKNRAVANENAEQEYKAENSGKDTPVLDKAKSKLTDVSDKVNDKVEAVSEDLQDTSDLSEKVSDVVGDNKKAVKEMLARLVYPLQQEELIVRFSDGSTFKVNKLQSGRDYSDINIPSQVGSRYIFQGYRSGSSSWLKPDFLIIAQEKESTITLLKNCAQSFGMDNNAGDIESVTVQPCELNKEGRKVNLPKPTADGAVGLYVGDDKLIMICKLVGGTNYAASKIPNDSRDRFLVRLKGGKAVIAMADNPQTLLQALKGFGVRQNLGNITNIVTIPCPINTSVSEDEGFGEIEKQSEEVKERSAGLIGQDTKDLVELGGFVAGKDTSQVLDGIDTINDGAEVARGGKKAYDAVKAGNYGELLSEDTQGTIKLAGDLTGKDTSQVVGGIQIANDGIEVAQGGKAAYDAIKDKNYKYLASDDAQNTVRKGSKLVSGFIEDEEKRAQFEGGAGQGLAVMGAANGTFKVADKVKNKDYEGLLDEDTRNTVDSIGKVAGYETSDITTNMKTAETGVALAKGIKNGDVVESMKGQEIGFSQPGGAKLTSGLTEEGDGVKGSFDTGMVDTGFYGVTVGADGNYEARVDKEAGEATAKVDGNAKIGYSQLEVASVGGSGEVTVSKHEDAKVRASVDNVKVLGSITVADKNEKSAVGQVTGLDDMLEAGNDYMDTFVSTHDENGERIGSYDREMKMRQFAAKQQTRQLRSVARPVTMQYAAGMAVSKGISNSVVDKGIAECDERIANATSDSEREHWIRRRRALINQQRGVNKTGMIDRKLESMERVNSQATWRERKREKKIIDAERKAEGITYKVESRQEDGQNVNGFDQWRYNKAQARLDKLNGEKQAIHDIRRVEYDERDAKAAAKRQARRLKYLN